MLNSHSRSLISNVCFRFYAKKQFSVIFVVASRTIIAAAIHRLTVLFKP